MKFGKYIASGSKVELQPIRKDSNIEVAHFSKVNQVLDDDRLEIMMPIEDSKVVLLARNIPYQLFIYSSTGLYECKVKAGDRYKSGGIYLQQLVLLTEVKKYQRREFYRYACSIPVFSRHLMEEEKENLVWDDKILGKEGESIDLGGGGVRFKVKERFEPEELIICTLKLIKNDEEEEEIEEIQTLAKVLDVTPVEFTRYYEIRVQFEKISKEAREKLIVYIFEEERKRRKKNSGL